MEDTDVKVGVWICPETWNFHKKWLEDRQNEYFDWLISVAGTGLKHQMKESNAIYNGKLTKGKLEKYIKDMFKV